MKRSTFRLGVLSAALFFFYGSAQATNGLFLPGFGNRSIGMGGVGIAYGRDSLSTAANPANIVNTGMRGDMGVAIFNGERHACTGPSTGLLPERPPAGSGDYPQAPYGFDGCSESDNKYYIMPEMGMTMPLTEQLHVGMAFVPLGGGGTSYPKNFFSYPATTPPTPTSDVKLGVDLMILQAPITVGYKLNDDHAIAASLSLAVARFRAYGLQAFKTFDATVTTITSDPEHLTNLGYDYSYGAGFKLGWLGEFLDDKLTLGLVYHSRTYMTKFDKYRGLFAEQGDFDIPESYGIGFAYKPIKNLVIAADVLRVKYTDVASIGNPGPGSYSGLPAQALNGLPSALDPSKELGNDDGMGFGFSDQTVYKLGVQYGINKRLQVRAGFNYGKNPIADNQLTFATLAPANTEKHYSLGFTYKATEELEISGAYMYVPSNPQSSPLVAPQNTNSVAQNVVGAASIDMHQNIFGLTMSWVLDPGLSEYGDDEMEALDFTGVYLGFGMGQARLAGWKQYSNDFVSTSFGAPTLVSSENISTGFKVFGGYQVNQYLGVEAGFVDFNDVKARSTVTATVRSVYTKAENDAWTLAAVGTLPITKSISVFGKLGASSWSSNLRSVATESVGPAATTSASESRRGYDVFYGLGVSYALVEDMVDLRAEIERYKVDNVDINLMTGGLAVKF